MKISKVVLLTLCGAALVLLPRRSSKAQISPALPDEQKADAPNAQKNTQ